MIKSDYNGVCPVCYKDIKVGDPIAIHLNSFGQGEWAHVPCCE